MSNSATSLEPGWRPDPSGRYEYRYWDGQWTNRVANSTPGADRSTAPPAPAVVAPAAAAATVPVPEASSAPVAPFGIDDPAVIRPTAEPAAPRVGIWTRIKRFITSFSNQPESYHSDLAGPELEELPRRGESIIMARPANYGRAGIVALAAIGLAAGAYLPWLAGTFDDIRFSQTGFDMGQGWGFWVGAAALAVAALLSVQVRKMRWIAMAVAIVLAGLVVRELLDTYDRMQSMNLAQGVSVEIGPGLWIMVASAAVAMIAGFRLSEDEKIV